MNLFSIRYFIVTFILIAAMLQSARAMTERELMDSYLATVEEAVDVFEPLWVEGDVPGAGHFDFQGYQNWSRPGYVALITTPGNGELIFCYALLLTETDKQTFGKSKVPRAVIRDHALKAIRWIVMTSGHVPGHVNFPIPGLAKTYLKDGGYARKINQPHDSLGWFTVGSAILWDQIDADTKAKMEYMFKGNAQQERAMSGWRLWEAGFQDRAKKNMSITTGAAFLLSDARERAKYRDIITGNLVSLVGTEHDFATSDTVAGKPMYKWAIDWNLYPDYSSDHHRWAQVWYGSDALFEGRYFVQLLSRITNTPVPETATWPGNGFRGVLAWDKSIVTPEGEPASAHGMEYDSYYGSGLLAFAYGATIEKDPVAAALEEQAALLHSRQASAVRQYDYHRNSWAKASAAYLMHKFEGPRAEPLPLPDAMAALRGTYHYKWHNNIVQRTGDKFVSFAWGSMLTRPDEFQHRYPRGWVIPARGWQPGMEPLVYMHPETLFGNTRIRVDDQITSPGEATTTYNAWRDDAAFNATGESVDDLLARRGAFHSFERGPAVWLLSVEALRPMTLDWSGVPFHFYARDGVTTSRLYADASGSVPLEQPIQRTSPWWSVDDQLGIATLGLGDQIDIHREPGFNWARKPDYRDKVDVVAIGAVKGRPLNPGQTLDSVTVIYPGATAAQIAAAQASLTQLDMPDGWRGADAPDAIQPGLRHLAVTRLHGASAIASLNLSYPEGAPVLRVPTLINGKTAHASVALDAMHSLTDSFDLYISSSRPVIARRVAFGRYSIEPIEKSAKLRIFFTDSLNGVNAKWVGRVSDPTLKSNTLAVRIDSPVTLELAGDRYADAIPPAVELAAFNNREDGRMQITVEAADRSEIASVELLCDGKSITTLRSEPWEFAHKPGDGLHTYEAIATDKKNNRRASFKRTVEAKTVQPGMNLGR
ncbi:MAG: Ig-like domain-containing protein [Candidatus Sumerlaeia bacterium]